MNSARNNYLLALTAINSLQKLYDQDDLPQLMIKVDGFFYDVLASVLQKYTVFETDLCVDVNACMEQIRNEADQVSRDKDVQQFLDQYAAFFKPSTLFSFESVGADEVRDLVADEFSKIDLGRKLGELIAQDNHLTTLQETKEKELVGAEQLVEINPTSPQTGNTSVSPLELKQDIQNALDLIKCQRTKLIQQMKCIKTLNGTDTNTPSYTNM